MRDLMIDRMREEIRNPNGCNRYGRFFYIPKVVDNKRDAKFNAKAKDTLINLNDLESLSDSELFEAYTLFVRRYSVWM